MINNCMYSSKTCEWGTPLWLFNKLKDEFRLNFDAAATSVNAMCAAAFRFDQGIDALNEKWIDYCGKETRIYLNPPYGRGIDKWISKALEESKDFLIVCLLPARTDTNWWGVFWDYENHKPKNGCEVRFIKGRLKFGESKNCAPFPSTVVIFDRRNNKQEKK